MIPIRIFEYLVLATKEYLNTKIPYLFEPYNNYYGKNVYSILGGRVSELIMYIAMSDKCWSKGKYRTVLYYDTKDNKI